ncbi:MAG: hypothetical protein AB8H47_03715 [Bacteroidia bacterium]
MKRLYPYLLIIAVAMLGSLQSFGQGISYQAVARNAAGALQANETINLRFYVLQGSATGTEVYRESHTPTTNDYALFSVVVGKGTVEAGDFNTVDWGADIHFLRVEINGTNMGETQLETVPYSKIATNMKIDHLTDVNIGPAVTGDVLKWDGSSWTNQTDAVNDADSDPNNEIQALSVSGSTLSLSAGGGSVTLPGGSPWTETGSNITYSTGNVGIGLVTNPSDLFEVSDSNATGRLVTFEKLNTATGNDVLEIRTQTGAPDGAAFIEMQRGSTVEARVRTDGSAEFFNVTVEDELDGVTSPAKGRVYANALPIAYGYVSSGSTTATLITDYGVASLTKTTGTSGEYRVTLNKTVIGQPVIIATSFGTSPNDEIVTANRVNATEIEINIVDGLGVATNSNFYFVVYGKVQ